MRIERITRKGKEFAVIPLAALQKLIGDAETLADVKAYDTAKGRLERGDDELVPFEIVERRSAGESPLKICGSIEGSRRRDSPKPPGFPAP